MTQLRKTQYFNKEICSVIPCIHYAQEFPSLLPVIQGRTGTFSLGWRYGSNRARRASPGLKWVTISKVIRWPMVATQPPGPVRPCLYRLIQVVQPRSSVVGVVKAVYYMIRTYLELNCYVIGRFIDFVSHHFDIIFWRMSSIYVKIYV